MSIPQSYTYLFGTILLMVIWGFIFYYRKDLRKEMVIMSLLVGLLSVVTGYLWWTVDWWRPQTITGTIVGVEDFLVGFGSGGFMTAVYKFMFGIRSKENSKLNYYKPIIVIGFLVLLTGVLFWLLNLHSFIAVTTSLLLTSVFMFSVREDLFWPGFVSGLAMVIISIPIYLLMIYVTPGWVEATYLNALPLDTKVLNVPIEEFVFWFLAGVLFGPFYDYWAGIRVNQYPNNSR